MSLEEKILQTSKEIVVKFIEVGRVSPTSFGETFKEIYKGVKEAVEENPLPHDEHEQEHRKKKK
ncbi:MAG: hypothetical protein ACLFOY_05060 [Desulfatibacillaceae bacterium]